MQREMLSWAFTGIAVLMLVGLCVVLRPPTKPEQSPMTPAYQPSTPPIPASVQLVSLRGDAAAHAFSNDEQRVYFAHHNGITIDLCEYTISSKAERTLARFQVPNGLHVGKISIDENRRIVALLTTASEPQSTKAHAVVIPPTGRAKTITHRLVEGCTIEAVADNGAAIAGYYTRTVRRDPFQMERRNPMIFEPPQYRIPAPYFERAIPHDFRMSEQYATDDFAPSMDIPGEHENEFSKRPHYRVRRDYNPPIRYFPDLGGGGGGPPPDMDEQISPDMDELFYRDPFTFTEQYLFCSIRGRLRSTKVNWDGDCVVIGVSASGSTVAGNYSHKNRGQGFIWRVGTGIRTVRYPGSRRTQLFWLSPRGDIVLGLAAISDKKTLLFRWSRRGGYKRLGEIPGSIEEVSIPCVAPNGQAILLNQSSYPSSPVYFVWSEQLGFRKSERLGDMLLKPLCISNSGKKILAETQWGVAFVKVE